MDENEIYNLVCKDKFAAIEKTLEREHDQRKKNHEEIMSLLRGHNKNAGLIDDIRDVQKINKYIGGAVIFIISVLFVQFVKWIFAKF